MIREHHTRVVATWVARDRFGDRAIVREEKHFDLLGGFSLAWKWYIEDMNGELMKDASETPLEGWGMSFGDARGMIKMCMPIFIGCKFEPEA